MKQFFVRKDEDRYFLTFVDSKGIQRDVGLVEDEDVVEHILFIDNYVSSIKTEEEIIIDELKEKQQEVIALLNQQLTDEEKANFISIYPTFKENHEYKEGDEFSYEGTIYRVLQDHLSNHYRPNEAVSWYVDILNKLTIEEWKQPTGERDAYMIGDKVLWQGEVYRSIIDNNVWSPTDYPQGWEKE